MPHIGELDNSLTFGTVENDKGRDAVHPRVKIFWVMIGEAASWQHGVSFYRVDCPEELRYLLPCIDSPDLRKFTPTVISEDCCHSAKFGLGGTLLGVYDIVKRLRIFNADDFLSM
jgi:hypothetical protein